MNSMRLIFIFDNDPDILELFQLMFKGRYLVMTSQMIQDPVAEVKAAQPDLILMDHDVPFLGGPQAIQALKMDPHTQSIPVYLFSPDKEGPEIANDCGANGCILKPFHVAELLDFVNDIMLETQYGPNVASAS